MPGRSTACSGRNCPLTSSHALAEAISASITRRSLSPTAPRSAGFATGTGAVARSSWASRGARSHAATDAVSAVTITSHDSGVAAAPPGWPSLAPPRVVFAQRLGFARALLTKFAKETRLDLEESGICARGWCGCRLWKQLGYGGCDGLGRSTGQRPRHRVYRCIPELLEASRTHLRQQRL